VRQVLADLVDAHLADDALVGRQFLVRRDQVGGLRERRLPRVEAGAGAGSSW
jgi:hypothetical protein